MPVEANRLRAESDMSDGWADLVAGDRGPVLALIMLGSWLVAADAMVVATIMPSVGASLNGFEWFGWATSLFMTGLVVAAASSNWLADRLGLRTAMRLAGISFAIGCGLSALGSGIGVFLVGRAVQGCAAGWLSGLTYVALATLFPVRHIPRIFAILTSTWAIATVAGPVLGGMFADAGAWRGIFWLFAVQGLVFAAASTILIPWRSVAQGGGTLPWRSIILLTLSIGAISCGSVVDNWRGAAVLVLAGFLLLLVGVVSDRQTTNSLIPARAHNPQFPLGSAYLMYFLSAAAGTSFILYGPTLLQHRAGLSALEAGYMVSTEALAWTGAALLVSGATEVWRPRLLVIGPLVILAGTTAVTFSLTGGSLHAVAISGVVLGAGYGLCFPVLAQFVMGAFDDAGRPQGSSAISAARSSGGAVGAAVAAVAANAAGFEEKLEEVEAFWVTWAALGTGIPFALAAVVVALRIAFLCGYSPGAEGEGDASIAALSP